MLFVNLKQKKEKILEEIRKLKCLRKTLFPVEHKTINKVLETLWNKEKKLKSLAEKIERTGQAEELNVVYKKILSFKPLKWRDEHGLPRLVIFNPLESDFSLISWEDMHDDTKSGYWTKKVPNGSFSITPSNLPRGIKECYDDVLCLLKTETKTTNKTAQLKCQFGKTIPSEIKEKIREAENYFGKKIFIIAEPKELRINNPNNKIEGGYLIVGYDSEAIKDCLWLIESFKTSALKIKPKSSTLEKTEQTATAKRDRTKVEADEAEINRKIKEKIKKLLEEERIHEEEVKWVKTEHPEWLENNESYEIINRIFLRRRFAHLDL